LSSSILSQNGDLPLHWAAAKKGGMQVVAALLEAFPAGACTANKV